MSPSAATATDPREQGIRDMVIVAPPATAPRSDSSAVGQGPPLNRLLADLDPRSAHLAIHVRAERFGGAAPRWPADRAVSSVEATARFDGPAFIIDSVATDHARGTAVAETLAFDGRRTFSRGEHSPGWLLVSRSAPLPADLEQLGFADQSGRALVDGTAGGESLTDLLDVAIETNRVIADGAVHVTFVRRGADGAPASHERFDLAVEPASKPTGGEAADDDGAFARFGAFSETSLTGEPGEATTEIQRRERRATRWGDFDGVSLPAESEHRLEKRQPNGGMMSTRIDVSVLDAHRVDPAEVRAAIASFAVPRPGETVFETDLRLQFRVGERRFTLAGAHYEAEAPLLEVPDGSAAEMIATARRLDGATGSMASGGRSQGTAGQGAGDVVGWLQLAIGAAFVGLGVAIWRRASIVVAP